MTCIWEYDKRSVNGANFVYYGMFLRGVTGEREKALVAYAQQVKNIPSHSKNIPHHSKNFPSHSRIPFFFRHSSFIYFLNYLFVIYHFLIFSLFSPLFLGCKIFGDLTRAKSHGGKSLHSF